MIAGSGNIRRHSLAEYARTPNDVLSLEDYIRRMWFLAMKCTRRSKPSVTASESAGANATRQKKIVHKQFCNCIEVKVASSGSLSNVSSRRLKYGRNKTAHMAGTDSEIKIAIGNRDRNVTYAIRPAVAMISVLVVNLGILPIRTTDRVGSWGWQDLFRPRVARSRRPRFLLRRTRDRPGS